MANLLSRPELPEGFEYPTEFLRIVGLGLTRLEPWWIVEGGLLEDRYRGLKSRYPKRTLVPFAVRQDRDDVACFDLDSKDVVVIHDFTDAGWERRTNFAGFNDWLRQAIDDLIDFGAD